MFGLKRLFYNSSFFVLLFIAVSGITLIFCDWSNRSSLQQNFTKIDGDGKDYYSYLTSAFITKDLSHLSPDNSFVVETPTGNINLHPVGVAVLQLPFFGLGYLSAGISDQKLDGFSLPFQLAISLAALFYLIVGLVFIHKTLVNSGFRTTIIFASIICLFFGTTLLNYVLTEPSMSHVYSFALISAFVYYGQKSATGFSARNTYILACIFGLIILVRPVNALVLFLIPFFYHSFSEWKSSISVYFHNRKTLIISIGIVAAVFSIQSVIWFMQTGQFFQSSYKGNGFYFLHPQVFPMLFGFNSGIFVYTPLFFVVLFGLYIIYKQNKFKALSLSLFLVICLYVFSSYWGWTYFDGIGTRPFVDFYSLAAIGLCYAFTALNSFTGKGVVSAVTGLCVLFNLIVCYQYKEGIIQSCGMNYDKFKYTFLKTSSDYKNVLGGCYDLQPYSAERKEPFVSYQTKFEDQKNHFYQYNKNEYGVGFESKPLAIDSRKIHIKIGIDRLETTPNASKDVVMTLSLNDNNNNCKSWQTFKLNDAPSEVNYSNWKHYDYGVNVVSTITETDKLSIFVWNKGKEQFGIDNFKVELYDYGHIN